MHNYSLVRFSNDKTNQNSLQISSHMLEVPLPTERRMPTCRMPPHTAEQVVNTGATRTDKVVLRPRTQQPLAGTARPGARTLAERREGLFLAGGLRAAGGVARGLGWLGGRGRGRRLGHGRRPFWGHFSLRMFFHTEQMPSERIEKYSQMKKLIALSFDRLLRQTAGASLRHLQSVEGVSDQEMLLNLEISCSDQQSRTE